LATDAAVTLSIKSEDGEREKVYHTLEKLFSLSPPVPVVIMTFGAADTRP